MRLDSGLGSGRRQRRSESARRRSIRGRMSERVAPYQAPCSFPKMPSPCEPEGPQGLGRRDCRISRPILSRRDGVARRLGRLGCDEVADSDLAVAEDVCAQAATVGERCDGDAGELLKVGARLTEAIAVALDLADPEAFADKVIEAHVAGDDVAPRLASGEA